jgi:hypothetical protein
MRKLRSIFIPLFELHPSARVICRNGTVCHAIGRQDDRVKMIIMEIYCEGVNRAETIKHPVQCRGFFIDGVTQCC